MLPPHLREKLIAFAQALINQERAHVVIEPQQRAEGFWFGGGNLVEAPDGTFYLVGRYRNQGDSRTGLAAGARGLELAIFASDDRGQHFSKVVSLTKSDLDLEGKPVLSIEGSALHFTSEGVELFVSSEKDNIPYPNDLAAYKKPGTGVWTIERLLAPSIADLTSSPIESLLSTQDPRFLHVKDPLIYERTNGDLLLGFCTHPFSWTSSNSAYVLRKHGADIFGPPVFDFFRRGFTWDVAMTRITHYLRVPSTGAFAQGPTLTLIFYDGGESLRRYEEHAHGVSRPRGYSCEELGGLAVMVDDDPGSMERLSRYFPLFVSPWGTGCSRYVDVLQTQEGFYATWQQGQADGSQPLVANFVSREEAERLLS